MRRTTGDEGFTLIETIVALLVFAIISGGIISATITVSRMTADNQSREVAANLVAQDMDTVRAIGDPLKIPVGTTTMPAQVVSGRTYTVSRKATLLSVAGQTVSCGTAGTVAMMQVNDTVTWTGQLAITLPVRSDTLLAPKGLITSTSSGAISILASNASGTGTAGLTVTVTPTSGGAALTTQPAVTDVNGCSTATLVTPGTYSVTLSRSNYLTPGQASTSVTTSVVVSPGTTTPVTAQYDAAASFTVNYTPSTAVLPTNLPTTFIPYSSSAGGACVTAAPAATVSLFPYTAGYSGIAGASATADSTPSCGAVATGAANSCLAVDPVQWPGTGLLNAGSRGTPSSGATPLSIRVGTAAVTSTAAGYLTAVSATDPNALLDGNPGCATSSTLKFGQVLTAGTVTVGLPFGSWTLYSGSTSGALTTKLAATTVVPSSGSVAINSSGSAVVTLDPRLAK